MKAHFTRLPIVTLALCLGAAAARADSSLLSLEMQEEAARAYRDAYNLVIREDWPGAIQALQELQKRFGASDWADDAQFWLCYAQERTQSAPENTFECYRSFVRSHSRSEWVNDAKMNMVRLASQLTRLGKPQYEEAVKSFRTTSNIEIELAVLIALLDIGDEGSIGTVLQRLDGSENEELRARIVRSLGDHAKSALVMSKLAELARRDPSPKVRRSAVQALGEVKSPESFAVLKEVAVSGEDIEVRKTAIRELGDMRLNPEESVRLLKGIALESANKTLEEAAVYGLRDLRRPEAMTAMIEIYDSSTSEHARRAVVRAVGDRPLDKGSALQFLSRAASSDSETAVRRSALHSIADLKTPQALERLTQIAGSNEPVQVREAAYSAIGNFKGPGPVEALISLAKIEKDARLRGKAASALGDSKQDAAVVVLVELAKSDPNSDVRRAAVRALGEIGTPAARDALIQLLRP